MFVSKLYAIITGIGTLHRSLWHQKSCCTHPSPEPRGKISTGKLLDCYTKTCCLHMVCTFCLERHVVYIRFVHLYSGWWPTLDPCLLRIHWNVWKPCCRPTSDKICKSAYRLPPSITNSLAPTAWSKSLNHSKALKVWPIILSLNR